MKYEYEYITVSKLSEWAENLPNDIDFLDYWFNLSLSNVKFLIESDIVNKINAFEWTRWQNDFEREYQPQPGEGYDRELRFWFADFSQMLVYSLQISSKEIARYYGKDKFAMLAEKWYQYHIFGTDHAINRFAETFGLPPTVKALHPLAC
ncbi:MAG: hypothetical protein FWF81_06925 [Defluviitaleaceae bacterium]|nr:hypothetical protein [Defluviitaleaceae bacterium]